MWWLVQEAGIETVDVQLAQQEQDQQKHQTPVLQSNVQCSRRVQLLLVWPHLEPV
jgi:hypothetical protein